MPYFTKDKCVYKKTTGKKVGCTKGSVKKYLAALHANVHESLEFKDVFVDKDETEASVYYTLADNPSIEIGLVFNLIKSEDEDKPTADYAYGVLNNGKGSFKKFEDPLEIKNELADYELEPDDVVRRGEESYEIIEDTLNSQDDAVKESLAFDDLYNKLLNS